MNHTIINKYFLGAVFLLATLTSCIREPKQYENTNEGNFDALWSIIDTRYCYLDYKNIDWDEAYDHYHSKLNSIQNDKYALFDLFAEMLAELKDGHVNLYSNFDVSRYNKWYTDSATNYYSSVVYSDDYVGSNYRVAGGMRYGKLKKNEQIGYIYYGSFGDSFSDGNIKNIFTSFKDCAGLIIDVRNNGGGSLSYAEQLASYFFDEETVTSYMLYKNGNGHSDFSKPTAIKTHVHKNIHWDKPVIVLTNRYSYSATNDFVLRMKKAPKAFVVGSWTGGGGGMPLSSELPNGWMVRFSACPMLDTEMSHTEMGIAPDYHVIMTESDRDNNKDIVIHKAVEIILNANR